MRGMRGEFASLMHITYDLMMIVVLDYYYVKSRFKEKSLKENGLVFIVVLVVRVLKVVDLSKVTGW